MSDGTPSTLPDPHRAFLRGAIAALGSDPRILGVAAGGSYLSNTMDEFSDLDLIVAVEPDDHAAVMSERGQIAGSLGPLLRAFTGEHVGEPRLLICLYGPPLLHVDLKFVALPDLAPRRVETPAVLWERDGRLTGALRDGQAVYPAPNLEWIHERFWVWVHYGAGKIARGELFEAIDFISFLRVNVLGPLCLLRSGARPAGVRRIETDAPELADQLKQTVPSYDAGSCLRALRACIDLYRRVRVPPGGAVTVEDAERAAVEYLGDIERRCGAERPESER
jgi:hypothetical protein